MNYVLKTQLEKLLLEIQKENQSNEPYCVGGFIIQPIYWAELENEEIVFDEESMMDQFQYFISNNLSQEFYDNQYERSIKEMEAILPAGFHLVESKK